MSLSDVIETSTSGRKSNCGIPFAPTERPKYENESPAGQLLPQAYFVNTVPAVVDVVLTHASSVNDAVGHSISMSSIVTPSSAPSRRNADPCLPGVYPKFAPIVEPLNVVV